MKVDDQQLNLPAGFRFHPTDEELVVHYLIRRCAGQQISTPIVAEIDLYKFDPWQLPGTVHYFFFPFVDFDLLNWLLICWMWLLFYS